jgi:broad specificity phosphatase PhoE
MQFYFLRHGESSANLLRQFSNRGDEHPLTEHGLQQARQAAQNLTGVKPACIYASPVLRARQTATILAESLGAPLEIREALREWDVGIYEGTTDPQGWELHRQVQEDWFDRQKLDSQMPGGESFLEIRRRFVPFIEGLLAAGKGSQHQYVLVSHGGLYTAMLPVILQNVDFDFAREHGFPYTGCIRAEERDGRLYCTDWCGEGMG